MNTISSRRVRQHRLVGLALACAAALLGPDRAPDLFRWRHTVLAQTAEPCVFTRGYWSTHPSAWPLTSLVLGNAANGNHTYTQQQLLSILDAPARRDASLTLAAQLIATELNFALGSSPAPVVDAANRADTLLAAFQGRLPYNVAPNTPVGADMLAAAAVLDDYNNGLIPGSCGGGNTRPIANAGPDQTAAVGSLVTLDGGGSSDADGDALTFQWSFIARPATSQAALSDPTAVMPAFVLDVPGVYEVQLVVNDGRADSAPDTVVIANVSRPIANAGPNQTTPLQRVVQLDGSGSSDADGDPLTFAWSLLSAPGGSVAALSNPTTVNPTLVADVHGDYLIQLVVSDGGLDSEPDTVTISTINSVPVADAGEDTSAFVLDVVTLDASGSNDVDGDPLTFRWSLSARPVDSHAVLSDATLARPTFVIDKPGTYVAQLIVNDGVADSAADHVTITTLNSRPHADAGDDQLTFVGSVVQLDGSRSSDVDGDLLSHRWSFTSVPPGSAAALSDSTAVRPTFTVDLPGTYVAQLIVNDGALDSAPDTVTASTANRPPIADAGPDQTVVHGTTVNLDGSLSSDPDGDALTFRWALTSVPPGSTATLSDAASVTPSFIADLVGTYVAQLIVNDGTADSAPDTVALSTENSVPAADAGPDQTVATGATVQLDGSGSSDPDGTPLQFFWSLTSRPAGSIAVLLNPAAVNPTFVADRDGLFVAQLIVGDGVHQSDADTVAITAQAGADLRVEFSGVSPNPAVGSTFNATLDVRNGGPASAADVAVLFKPPAGYTVTNVAVSSGSGPYDQNSGEWAVGTLANGGLRRVTLTLKVSTSGPYDLSASITHSSVPDPNAANNTVTAAVTPNANADLRMVLFNPPSGTHAVGTSLSWTVEVRNDGPSTTAGVTVQHLVPAGYTITNITVFAGGPYDATTGTWNVGSLALFGLGRVAITARVNAIGPTGLSATITHADQPDPNPANNTVTSAPINRPPVANAGPDQSAATHATVALDGSLTSDPEHDPLTFEWSFVLRPVNSAATLIDSTTAAASFIPDQGGTYTLRLTATDPSGASSTDTVNIAAAVLNHPPVFRSAPNTIGAVGQPYHYAVIAQDPDAGDTLTFALAAAPTGMTIGEATGIIGWVPVPADAGPQAVTVRVEDSGGLFALQSFAIQVSSANNQAPVAADDVYEVRVDESLGVGSPGVLHNDADETPLTSRLLTGPANGTLLFNTDGSFVYTPHTQQPGEMLLAENVNLANRLPGVTVNANGFSFHGSPCGRPECAIDENPATSWSTSFQSEPFLEVQFPQDVLLSRVEIVGHRNTFLLNLKITAGILQVFAADGTELYNSGNVELIPPARDATFVLNGIAGVRRVRFSPTAGDGGLFGRGFAELKVIGSALMRREATPETNLPRLLASTVRASSVTQPNIPEALIDETSANWYAATANAGEFVQIDFAQDTTVTSIRSANPAGTPQGFGTSLLINCFGTFTLLDAAGTVLFDSGQVNHPTGSLSSTVTFTLDTGSVPNVRSVRYSSAGCSGFQLGFSEISVFGTANVETPAFAVAKKFQVLAGREAHSTPIVVNLTDDNGDGVVDSNDIPDIVVPVEEGPNRQLTGFIMAVSGDDGRELFTAGAPDLVSPWSELAAADLDGDGLPEIVAVHSDGNHLIAFDHTGALKWVSDAHPMPTHTEFTATGNIVRFRVGAVAIANLDGAGPPEIVIGASVFDSNGRLLADGRTLGGTTGTNTRSAIPAIADIDLDGVPEIVAGPTAYRWTGGALTKIWQRSDRSDGYAGIANLDDDPQAEIVVVGNGAVYVLNHDGSDAEVWNAPTRAPVPLPAGGQGGAPLIVDVDGDGRPEIGVAGAANYVLFNRDGSIRWQSVIRDRSSHSTGSIAFDLDGDGRVEIIYRDEFFLRIYRGSDGVLLAKTPVGSATWAEVPVVADVDNDGHADLIVSSDFLQQAAGVTDTGIIVLQDVANKWTRTRRIWNQHAYQVTNVNEDASIPLLETPHWLVPGLNSFRTNAFPAGATADRADSFTYVAEDGVLQSNAATVRINVRTPNAPPQITSAAVTSAAHGVLYTYAVTASDPDPSDILTFSLPTAPAGMTIDPIAGLVHWVPTEGQPGSHDVVVKVEDLRGLYALQGFTVIVADAIAVPDVLGQLEAAAAGAIVAAQLAVGAVSTRHSPTVAEDSVISQSPAAGTLVAPGASVNLVVSLGPAPEGTVPDVVGMPQASAEADLLAAGFVAGTIVGQISSSVPPGVVISQSPIGGSEAATGSPVDLVVSSGPPPGDIDFDRDGFTRNQGDCNDTDASIHPGAFDIPGDGIDQNCNGADSIFGDDTPPTASIASPAEDAEITMPTDIVGSVTDANFLRYTLSIAEVESTSFVTIGTGTSAVVNGVLGRLDPTLLENGMYRVRLVAEDVNGQIDVDERVYQVGGEAKIGILALSFVDLQVPVSGIPITVVRSYDSRVKVQRDFGVGWSLQVKTGTYRNNRRPGDGWSITTAGGPFGLPCSVVTELRTHVTEVRLSDREFYRFRPRLTNLAAVVGGCVGTFTFDFVNGTIAGARLDVLGGSEFIYTSGDALTHFEGDEETGLVFDPRRVRLTTIDGRVIDFDRSAGITRIQDSNDNALTVSPAGIIHSSGKSIAIARDARGRVVRITDPMGAALSYAYSGDDLTEFIDQAGNRTTFAYDERHNLLEIVDPLGNRPMRSEYDADGRLIAVIDAKGGRTAFSHDIDGREEVIVDALGHSARVIYDDRGNVLSHEKFVTIDGEAVAARSQYQYDSNGNETSIVDADARRQENTWDAFGNQLAKIVDPTGLRITRAATYTPAGHALTETDPNGDTMRFAVDSRGNTTEWIDVDGRSTSVGYDSAGQVIRVQDADGRATSVRYDAAGRVLSRTDSLGHVTSSTYDANGNRLTETTSRTIDGNLRLLTTRYEYDAFSRPTRIVDALGHSVVMAYDALGRMRSRTDQLGRVTTFEYDAFGDLTKTTYPDGTTESREYDARGDLIKVVDREGLVTTFEYDELRRRTATVLPNGGVARTIYSPGGQVLAAIAPDGSRTDYVYDAAGRRTLMRQPPVADGLTDGTVRPEWRFEYDAGGRVVATIDPRGHRREISYDSTAGSVTTRFPDGAEIVEHKDQWGRTLRRTDEEGNTVRFDYLADTNRLVAVTPPPPSDGEVAPTWRFTYDETGNRLSQLDPLGRTTRFRYDEIGRLTRLTLPGGQTRSFDYDAVGHLTRLTDFDGATTTYEYDAADRLSRRVLADGSVVAFTYTAGGRRHSVVDARGATTYGYDTAGRLTEVNQPGAGVIQYAYDVNGRVTAILAPGGSTGYAYDAIGRLSRVDTEHGVMRYGYDTVGNLTDLRQPNDVAGSFVYDHRNRLDSLTYSRAGATLQSFAYSYTAAGRRASVAEAGATTTFQYDRLGRLIQETRVGTSPFTRAYEYDAVGNRTKVLANGVPTTYTYDINDRVLTAGSIGFGYDAKGNVTSRNQAGALTTYAWTPDNRLAGITTAAGVTGFRYDADGMRVEKMSPQGTVRYLVDGMNPSSLRQVLEERDGAGGLLKRHDYGVAPLSTVEGGLPVFYQADGQTSVRFLTDATGAVTDSYSYDAFGNLVQETGAADGDYLYTGQQLDRESGLYYLRERYYDPSVGRFLGLDPVEGDPQRPLSMHRYAYAGNDPINFADPNGDFFTIVGVSLAGLESAAGRSIQYSHQAIQLCRIKAFKKVASLAVYVKSAVAASEALTIAAGLIGSSINLGGPTVSGGGFGLAGGTLDIRLFQYEHPFSVLGSGAPGLTGEVEKIELTAKFPNPSQMDLEFKGKAFGIPPVTHAVGFDIQPQFRFRSFQSSFELEHKICDLEACEVPLGKVVAQFKGTVGATNGSFGASFEVGVKLDAPFLPEVGFLLLKLPDDWK